MEEVWGSLDLCVGSGRREIVRVCTKECGPTEKSLIHSLALYSAKPLQKEQASTAWALWNQPSLDLTHSPIISLRVVGGSLGAASRLPELFSLYSAASFSTQCGDCSCSDDVACTWHPTGCVKGEQMSPSKGFSHRGMAEWSCSCCFCVLFLCAARWALVSGLPALCFCRSSSSSDKDWPGVQLADLQEWIPHCPCMLSSLGCSHLACRLLPAGSFPTTAVFCTLVSHGAEQHAIQL